LASGLYGIGWWLREALRKKPIQLARPVISVGNLTVGGTGKTPAVAWIARWLRDRDIRVTLLSRGYGADDNRQNDEALLLEELLPDVPHLQGPDRVETGKTAIDELESQLLLLDDGFQHRRMARDLDLVLIDATCPWGHGHLLPRGLLREPVGGLRRAHAVLLTRCDQVDAARLADLRAFLQRKFPDLPVVLTRHHAVGLAREGEDDLLPLDGLRGRDVAAFSGIGRPEAFRKTLEQIGARVIEQRVFPDHFAYDRNSVRDLRHWASSLPEGTVMACTRKDLVKLRMPDLGGRPLYAPHVELEILEGQDTLEALLERQCETALAAEQSDNDSVIHLRELDEPSGYAGPIIEEQP
jgi:tetraacyldisaccharide 4'-kinase